jgi:acyl-CoA synthetase (AMP-forming)/AMP-acid ligase II
MSLRGTGQGGFFQRGYELYDVLSSAGLFNRSLATNLGKGLKNWGSTPAAGLWASAQRRPNDTGLIDDLGSLTFGDLDVRSNAIAAGLVQAGVKAGDGVGLFARNHRGFVESTMALNKIGANVLLLNTGFAGPQLAEVLARENANVVIYDEEFSKVVDAGGGDRARFVSFGVGLGSLTLEDLISGNEGAGLPDIPASPGRTTVLTSGTTGTPKGAQRESKGAGINSLVGLLGRMPLSAETRTFVVAPAFHSWGGAHFTLGSIFSATLIMRARFDPEDTLKTIDREKPQVMGVVPVMMQRMCNLGEDVCRSYDTSSLRVVGASGSALPGELAIRWMDLFGDNLYNFYGSTEVAQASIAMPDELRAVPGTAGRPPRGTVVKIFDAEGNEVPKGQVGRIFVGNDAQFDGYTGGGDKERVHGLMSSGDMGHFNEDGLLFVDGRDDDMIVSGGENVFPREVEDLLNDHAGIADAAVIGVPDDEFGQRLKGFVVLQPGGTLSEADLKGYVKDHLARYKVPRDIVFLDELPRNQTGKVLKRVLRES